MPSTSVPIYHHNKPLETLVPHLSSHLPHTLCLVRRLQFHAQSPDAHIYASFAPGDQPHEHAIWSAAFVDRSRAPETECWMYSSIENLVPSLQDSNGQGSIQQSGPSQEQRTHARNQLLSILSAIRTLGVPDVFAEQAPDQHADILIVGSMHEETLSILTSISTGDLKAGKTGAPPAQVSDETESEGNDLKTVGPNWTPVNTSCGPVHARSLPWVKFLYKTKVGSTASTSPYGQDQHKGTQTEELISSLGLEWTAVRPEEFALVRSRTSIPRRDRTLALLPSTGLRTKQDGKLVSWAFLGVDGSLTSLHVEPEFRGKGLGKAVSGRVLRMLGQGLVDGKGFVGLDNEIATGCLLSYSLTAIDNVGSIGVAKGLGGQQASIEYWVMIDLRRVSAVY